MRRPRGQVTSTARPDLADASRRQELERRLRALGIEQSAIDQAARSGHLVQLAAERVLADDHRYTAREIADLTEVDAETFLAHMTALGRPRPAPDECAYGQEDLEAAARIRVFSDLGLPADELLDQARVFRPALNHIAEAVLRLFSQTALATAHDETELAVTMAELAEGAAPLAEPLLGYVFRIYLRQGIRNLVVDATDLAAGRLPDTQEVTVCFADLAGFTALGERLSPEQLGRLTSRFAELAVAASGTRVRLVKLLGDAAMLVSPDTDAVLDSATHLLHAAATEGNEFPAVHAGVARGMAIPRSGDWYGPPINRASRIANIATATRIVADTSVKAAAPQRQWHALGEHNLKGITNPTALYELATGP